MCVGVRYLSVFQYIGRFGVGTVTMVIIPDQLRTRRSRLIYWLMWQVYLTDLGRGQVIGKVTQLFTEVMVLLLVIDKLGYANMTIGQILVFCMVGGVLVWVAGWLYQRLKIDKIQNLITATRNPILKDLHERLNNNEKERL